MDDDVWHHETRLRFRRCSSERGCRYFRCNLSPSNNTRFDVLRIVQHLINPHVAAPLSKRLAKRADLLRDFSRFASRYGEEISR